MPPPVSLSRAAINRANKSFGSASGARPRSVSSRSTLASNSSKIPSVGSGESKPREPLRKVQQVENARPHQSLILADAALDDIDDLVGIGREHRARDDVQRDVHHLGGDIEFARLRQRIPFRQQVLGDASVMIGA